MKPHQRMQLTLMVNQNALLATIARTQMAMMTMTWKDQPPQVVEQSKLLFDASSAIIEAAVESTNLISTEMLDTEPNNL